MGNGPDGFVAPVITDAGRISLNPNGWCDCDSERSSEAIIPVLMFSFWCFRFQL